MAGEALVAEALAEVAMGVVMVAGSVVVEMAEEG